MPRYHSPADRTSVTTSVRLPVRGSGWYLLRARGNGPAYPVLDVYPYATTSPIYVTVARQPISSPRDADYFVAWIARLEAAAKANKDWNTEEEKASALETLREARAGVSSRGAALPSAALHDDRDTLADADAHRGKTVAAAGAAQGVHQRGEDAGTAGAERVAQRDSTAVDVHLGGIELQLAHARDGLRRKRLVQLDQIELRRGDARRARAPCGWREPGRGPCSSDRHRPQPRRPLVPSA